MNKTAYFKFPIKPFVQIYKNLGLKLDFRSKNSQKNYTLKTQFVYFAYFESRKFEIYKSKI